MFLFDRKTKKTTLIIPQTFEGFIKEIENVYQKNKPSWLGLEMPSNTDKLEIYNELKKNIDKLKNLETYSGKDGFTNIVTFPQGTSYYFIYMTVFPNNEETKKTNDEIRNYETKKTGGKKQKYKNTKNTKKQKSKKNKKTKKISYLL
jgi:hypothetical protein